MQIFESNSSQTFIFNGITLPKNFIVIPTSSNHLAVYNCYDTKHQLLPSTHYNQIEVDGIVYASLSGLTNALTPVIYAKSNVTLLSGATFGTLQQVTNLGNTTNDEIILDGGAGIQFTQDGDTLGSIVNGGSQFVLNDGGVYGKAWSLDRSNLTDYRNYYLPNTGGTIALLSDMNSFQAQMNIISAQTISNTNQVTSFGTNIINIVDSLSGKTNSNNLTPDRIPYTQSGNTIIDSSRLLWDNTNSQMELNGNLVSLKLKENLNNYWITIGNNGFGNGSLAFKNHQGKHLAILQNPTSPNGQAQFAIGNTSSIPSESQLYVFGGNNGANIDMRGSYYRDEANTDWEGADWSSNPNSIGISYFGSQFSSTTATTLGYPKQKMGVIRWNEADKAIIVSNNATGVTSIMFGINDEEIGYINDKGFSYKSDFASSNTSNDRWLTDKNYVDSTVSGKANNSDVVHLTGNESITGFKRFTNPVELDNAIKLEDITSGNYAQIYVDEDYVNFIASPDSPNGIPNGLISSFAPNVFSFRGTGGSNVFAQFFSSNLTSSRSYTLPNQSGNIALSENTINLTGNQTVNGIKTFSNNTGSSISSGIILNNGSTALTSPLSIYNTSTGKGIYINNNAGGKGIEIETTGSTINNAIIIKKQGNESFIVANNGNVYGSQFYSYAGYYSLYEGANGVYLDLTASEDSFNILYDGDPMYYHNFNDSVVIFNRKGLAASATIDYLDLSANRNYNLPDKSGTFAMTSDVPVVGTFTPSTGGGITYSKSYYSKVGNQLTMQLNGEVSVGTTNLSSSSSFTLPNSYTVANVSNNRTVGTNTLSTASNTAVGSVRISENSGNTSTLNVNYGGTGLNLSTHYFSVTIVVEVN